MSDLIRREDAIKAVAKYISCDYPTDSMAEEDAKDLINTIPSADRPSEIIYGNEHNCIMTIFGECSYAETGCGDCAVVEKVRKALSADRPQGEWIEVDDDLISCRCSVCGWEAHLYEDDVYGMPYCPNCGARMKGADDEER